MYLTVSCRWTLSVYQSSKVGHNIANNSTFCSVATCTNLHLVHSWTQSPLSHKQGQGFYSGHTLRKKKLLFDQSTQWKKPQAEF